MAEGWAKHLKADVIEPYSAGITPAGISPTAIQVMAEAGVDISNQSSKYIVDLPDIHFDYVITLCDYARQHCPFFSRAAKHIHIPFEDPSFLVAAREEVLAAFRETRDAIKEFVETIPESLQEETHEP
jgi:arsenate reductase